MNTPLRVGVIGTGHLGSLHAKMLASLEQVVLAGVSDQDVVRARAVALTHATKAYDTVEELLPHVDAVTVATPTSAHFAVATAAIKAGKHLLIEKPITQTVAEAEQLCELARAAGVLVQVGHIERFNPAILALDKYEIHPMFVESHRLAQFNPRGTDVPVVLDLMIHDIDIILSFVQAPVKSVEANGVAVVSDSVDIANARIQFANGCVANVTASRISQKRMRKMRLFQQNGYISIDFLDGLAEVFRLLKESEPEVAGTMLLGELGSGKYKRRIVYELPEVKEVNALQHEVRLFVEAVRNGTRPVVSGEDGRRALEVATSIMEKIGQQQFHV